MIERLRVKYRYSDTNNAVNPQIIKDGTKALLIRNVSDTFKELISKHSDASDLFKEYNKLGEDIIESDIVIMDYNSFNTIIKLLHADSWPNATWEEFNKEFKTYLKQLE